jgi:predicted GNAT family acetyltransferase
MARGRAPIVVLPTPGIAVWNRPPDRSRLEVQRCADAATATVPCMSTSETDAAAPIVIDAPERERYEASIDGQLAGILEYKLRRDRIALIHTEVLPAFEGRGLASTIVRFALADARRRGLRVIATCPYVQRYLGRHPEDLDIVVARKATE